MKKIALILIAALVAITTYIHAGEPTKPSRTSWTRLNINLDDAVAYYNPQGIETTLIKNKLFNTAALLSVFIVPKNIDTDQGAVVSRSTVSILVIDCDGGWMMPVSDLYFNVQFPIGTTRPVARRDYDPSEIKQNTIHMEKKTPLYDAFCPLMV